MRWPWAKWTANRWWSPAGRDNTVRLWDARTGRPRREPLTGHTYKVSAVALGEVYGEPVVVSGTGRNGAALDVLTGRPRGEPLTGHTEDSVNAVALGEVDSEPVVASRKQ